MRLREQALILGAAFAAVSPAQAEKRISPYIEVGQVVDADLKNGGDVLTYTTVTAGIEAAISTRRTEIQINYDYQRRFDYQSDVQVDDVHSGLARISHQLVPDLLSLDAGGIAARSRVDMRGAAPRVDSASSNNTTQVFGLYAGPTLATQVGELDVSAGYQFGYVKVEDSANIVLPTGQERLDGYDSSTSHSANASIGMAPGVLPVGWQVSGGYTREDASQLDQRFEGKFVRGDLTVPITPTLAVVGGVGYEDIQISQRDALRGPGGAPVIDDDGRYVTDPSSPRLLAYDQDGLIYDAGVMWRPTSRTQLEARAGRRYGGTTYFGSLQHQLSEGSGISVVVYDGVESFGRLLNDNVSRLPAAFNVSRGGIGNGYNGCVFGTEGGQGGCLNDVFQSISTSNFRNRGVTALYSATRGRSSFGIGAGYGQRKYFAPEIPGAFTLDGVKDEMYFAQAFYAYELTRNSTLDLNAYYNRYKSGIAGASEVDGMGFTANYGIAFTRNLSASATGNLYSFDQEASDRSLIASALLAMRLQY